MLRTQVEKYSTQMHKMAESDALVAKLAAENETLVVAIRTLEDSINIENEAFEDLDRISSSSSTSSSSSKDCLEFINDTLFSKSV